MLTWIRWPLASPAVSLAQQCFRELHTQSKAAPKVANHKWKHYHGNWLSLWMGWWKYLCKYMSVCASLSHSSADWGVGTVLFTQLLTEMSAAMPEPRLRGTPIVSSPGELTRGQLVAGTHCSWSHLHLGLARLFYWPHLEVCWVLSTGFCRTQRAHRGIYVCPGLKAFQPFLVSWSPGVGLHCWAGAGLPWSRGEVVSCCPSGGFMLSQWPASMAGGQERTACLPLGFHTVSHCMLRYVLSWMPCLLLMDEDRHYN